MESEALSDASLVVVTLAVLSTGESAAVAEVVPEVMCTMKEAAGDRWTWLEYRRVVAVVQEGSVELSMDQLSPASVGRGSDTVDRKGVVEGERVDLGGRRIIKKNETEGACAGLAMSMAAPRT